MDSTPLTRTVSADGWCIRFFWYARHEHVEGFYDQIFATLILQNVFLCGENEGNVRVMGLEICKYENFFVILQRFFVNCDNCI